MFLKTTTIHEDSVTFIPSEDVTAIQVISMKNAVASMDGFSNT